MATKTTDRFSPEVRERGAEGAGACGRASDALGGGGVHCRPDRLCRANAAWLGKAEVGGGKRAGVPSGAAEKLKAPARESRALRQAREILRKARAYLTQAGRDRPFKR